MIRFADVKGIVVKISTLLSSKPCVSISYKYGYACTYFIIGTPKTVNFPFVQNKKIDGVPILKCLSIGTPKTINFPFAPKEIRWFYYVSQYVSTKGWSISIAAKTCYLCYSLIQLAFIMSHDN